MVPILQMRLEGSKERTPAMELGFKTETADPQGRSRNSLAIL